MYGLVLGQNGKANLVPADADSQLDIPREQQGWDAKPSSASPQLWAPGFARCRLPPAVSAGKAELGAERVNRQRTTTNVAGGSVQAKAGSFALGVLAAGAAEDG